MKKLVTLRKMANGSSGYLASIQSNGSAGSSVDWPSILVLSDQINTNSYFFNGKDLPIRKWLPLGQGELLYPVSVIFIRHFEQHLFHFLGFKTDGEMGCPSGQ